MTAYFVDTSALAKRYLNETGSTWVIRWITPTAGNITVISELAIVELHSVFARRIREGVLSPAIVVQKNFSTCAMKNK